MKRLTFLDLYPLTKMDPFMAIQACRRYIKLENTGNTALSDYPFFFILPCQNFMVKSSIPSGDKPGMNSLI